MDSLTVETLLEALGGALRIENIRAYSSHVRIKVATQEQVNEEMLRQEPVLAVFRSGEYVHLIVGPVAEELAQAVKTITGHHCQD